MDVISRIDIDADVSLPEGLYRLAAQKLIDLTPWHIMPRDLAIKRMRGLRLRYSARYVPFARRQDNDDLACIDPLTPAAIVIVHDFSQEGSERRESFASFWDWFRAAVEDMIAFD
jgi:hypothetical protein